MSRPRSQGFYTATQPFPIYGDVEFELGIPIAALASKKVLLVKEGWFHDDIPLPPGVEIVAYELSNAGTYFIFKPASGKWLNAVATRATFDGPGDAAGWSGP